MKIEKRLSNSNTTLPKGWAWTKLEKIVDIKYGKDLSIKELTENGYPVFGANGIIGYYNEYLYEDKQVLISCRGAYSGKVNLSPPKCFITHNSLVLETANQFKELRQFLFYVLQSVDKSKLVTGTAQPQVTINNAIVLAMPLPPLSEQHRIVEKIEELFTKLDAGVEALKKVKAELKRYRQSVLKLACEGKLVPTEVELARTEGRAYEHANALLERILKERRTALKKNEKGENTKYKEPSAPDKSGLSALPKGWYWTNVGQITDSMKNGIYKPSEFYTEDGTACLRMYNIDQGKIVWKNIKRMNLTKEEVDEYLLVPGDLLVNRVNSRELVGKAAVIPLGIEKCVFESKNIRVRVIDKIVNPQYLCYRFTSTGTEYFNRNAQQVVGMASISQPQIARFPLPLPPLAEQHRIVAEVEQRFSVTDAVEKVVDQNLKQAERLRQSILKRAFEGKLVPQDPNDEPAEKLLERIRTEKAKEQVKNKRNKSVHIS